MGAFLVVMQGAFPGILGTLKNLFLGLSSDPSVQSRTEDYAVVGRFISERPWFGRGCGTFLPTKYIILDNQFFLGVIMQMGFVRLAVVAILLLTGIFRRGRSAPEP